MYKQLGGTMQQCEAAVSRKAQEFNSVSNNVNSKGHHACNRK